jgi:hypothetical protein
VSGEERKNLRNKATETNIKKARKKRDEHTKNDEYKQRGEYSVALFYGSVHCTDYRASTGEMTDERRIQNYLERSDLGVISVLRRHLQGNHR